MALYALGDQTTDALREGAVVAERQGALGVPARMRPGGDAERWHAEAVALYVPTAAATPPD
jgi:hypothetical protein